MGTTRQSKVSRLVQKELGQIMQQNANTMLGGAFITVTTVRISPDLSSAKVYLSILNPDKDKVLKIVQQNVSKIRRELGNNVRNQLRVVPNLNFFIDDSLDYAAEINELLKK